MIKHKNMIGSKNKANLQKYGSNKYDIFSHSSNIFQHPGEMIEKGLEKLNGLKDANRVAQFSDGMHGQLGLTANVNL